MSVEMFPAADDFDVTLPKNPYPGLRPFEKHEWPIFLGRERMIDEVIARLIAQQLLVVHGDSGCGKSSLIKAGVLARLEQESARGGLSWRTCEMQPRDAPLMTLAASLASLDDGERDPQRVLAIRRVLNFGADAPRALANLVRRGDSDHVCVLLDQFEELFAFVRRGGRDEASLFVQLLVSLVEAPPPGLYAVVTMRSEFLGVCAQFSGLAEAVNKVQYLLPRMAHLDLVRAIREPAPAYNGQVARDLASRLVADAGGTQDELPLIQHGLMVLYTSKTSGAPDDAPWRLDVSDYDPECSGLAELLSNHADEVANRAEADGGRVVQRLFRALTETNAEGQAIRRPQTFGALLRVTGADEPTLRRVVDAFREEGASFLRPYGHAPIADDTIIDISHEALIRSWRKIADTKDGWLAREFQDGLIWKSLLVQAESFERDASSVLSSATAEEREIWLEFHNSAWAERYGGGWDRVTRLVRGSVHAARQVEAAERAASRKQFLLAVTVACLMFALLVVSLVLNNRTRALRSEAYAASAASLWNRLNFTTARTADDELGALWEIAAGSTDVRDIFIEQLTTEEERLLRLAKRPAPILRALGLRVPPSDADAAFSFALDSMQRRRDDSAQLARMGTAAQALAGTVTPRRAAAAFPELMDRLTTSTDAPTAVAYASVLEGVVKRSPPADPREALASIVSAFPGVAGMKPTASASTALVRLAAAATAVADRLAPEQALTLFTTNLTLPIGASVSHSNAVLSVLLAVANKLTPEQAQAEFSRVVERISSASDAMELRALGSVGQRLTTRLSDAQIQAIFPAWFARVQNTPHSAGNADKSHATRIAALLVVAQKFTPRLTPQQAHTVFSHFVEELSTVQTASTLSDLANIAGSLAGRLQPEDARAALTSVASIDWSDSNNSISMRTLLDALVPHISPSEAPAAFSLALSAIDNTVSPGELQKLASTAQGIAGTLSPAQAETAIQAALSQVGRTSDSDQLDALDLIVRSLTERVTPAQAQSLFPTVVHAINRTMATAGVVPLPSSAPVLAAMLAPAQRQAATASAMKRLRTSDLDMIADAAPTLQLLATSLTEDHAHRALQVFLREIPLTTDPSVLDRIGPSAEAVASRVAQPVADVSFPKVLAMLRERSDIDQIDALGAAAAGLAPRLSLASARIAASDLLGALRRANEPRVAAMLAALCGPLAQELTSDQAQPCFSSVVLAITSSAQSSAAGMRLGAAAEAVARRLTPEQARTLLPSVTTPLAARADIARRTDVDQWAALQRAGVALAKRLAPADAQVFVPQLMRAFAATTVASDEPRFASTMKTLTEDWPADRARATFISLLAWSATPTESARWALLLKPHLRPGSGEQGVGAVVEALKFPTASGAATDHLLDALKTIDSRAPGKDAGLQANLDWINNEYSSVMLDTQPSCPTPPTSVLACPARR